MFTTNTPQKVGSKDPENLRVNVKPNRQNVISLFIHNKRIGCHW